LPVKVSFFSNSLIHHQLPLCLELVKKIGNNFTFVATEPITEERVKLGYVDMNHEYDFVLNAHEGKEDEALKLLEESDVVIFGSAPERYMIERMKHNKLTFRYSERPLKQGRLKLCNPHTLNTMLCLYTRYIFSPQYMLCASAYTAGDCALVGAYWNKAYRWGYFPMVNIYEKGELDKKKQSEVLQIVWAGRFLDWKHPMDAVLTAEYLRQNNVAFVMNVIGRGEEEACLKKAVKEKNLEAYVKFLGPMSPEAVRKYMEKANIFLFTSDKREGWGAVLNEAMNSGCAVVANKEIGSVPFLVKDGENGLLYNRKDKDDLKKKVLYLAENPETVKRLGNAAYETMVHQWNPSIAAQRFLELCQGLIEGKEVRFSSGPCSKARWM